jgi:single-strand DNA-binding protein
MNKAILMGRLTKDPELKYTTTSNIPVCTFSLAVNRKFAKEGAQQADFINIVAWRSTAEFCAKWFKKGKQVAVIGSIQTRNWDDTEGKRHYATEVVADEVYFADSKSAGDSQGQGQGQGGGFEGFSPAIPPAAKAATPGVLPDAAPAETDDYYPVEDDSLPF